MILLLALAAPLLGQSLAAEPGNQVVITASDPGGATESLGIYGDEDPLAYTAVYTLAWGSPASGTQCGAGLDLSGQGPFLRDLVRLLGRGETSIYGGTEEELLNGASLRAAFLTSSGIAHEMSIAGRPTILVAANRTPYRAKWERGLLLELAPPLALLGTAFLEPASVERLRVGAPGEPDEPCRTELLETVLERAVLWPLLLGLETPAAAWRIQVHNGGLEETLTATNVADGLWVQGPWSGAEGLPKAGLRVRFPLRDEGPLECLAYFDPPDLHADALRLVVGSARPDFAALGWEEADRDEALGWSPGDPWVGLDDRVLVGFTRVPVEMGRHVLYSDEYILHSEGWRQLGGRDLSKRERLSDLRTPWESSLSPGVLWGLPPTPLFLLAVRGSAEAAQSAPAGALGAMVDEVAPWLREVGGQWPEPLSVLVTPGPCEGKFLQAADDLVLFSRLVDGRTWLSGPYSEETEAAESPFFTPRQE